MSSRLVEASVGPDDLRSSCDAWQCDHADVPGLIWALAHRRTVQSRPGQQLTTHPCSVAHHPADAVQSPMRQSSRRFEVLVRPLVPDEGSLPRQMPSPRVKETDNGGGPY